MNNFVCPSKHCCLVGTKTQQQQQCCASSDPSGSPCKQLGEWCDEIYDKNPKRCGQTLVDGKKRIMCDCEGEVAPSTCCEKAGGKRWQEQCVFDDILQCAHALSCDIDPNPNSGVLAIQCPDKKEDKNGRIDCENCHGQPEGTRCTIPGSRGIRCNPDARNPSQICPGQIKCPPNGVCPEIGECTLTVWPDPPRNPEGLWECLPVAKNCKMTGFYEDCSVSGETCKKNRQCHDGGGWFPSECDTGDSNAEKDDCCKRSNGDQAKWDPKSSSCVFPCKNSCISIGGKKALLLCGE